jgi:hypothetical protein
MNAFGSLNQRANEIFDHAHDAREGILQPREQKEKEEK